ncbi:choline transporter-like protein 5 isoform X3 [Fukomys damarensis]|uniref:choline transporter-like protein 5 isoform X3 n=1 Tax=Fukomys damarensis TaxID=885580 RepID=UPI00053FE2D9|nr:choline transporter-like protein 5 isoform X3 [Fukomys damarensis]XP_019060229.1 choline transporter-like protein 5 isoform X3 [Fukomys damarensis]
MTDEEESPENPSEKMVFEKRAASPSRKPEFGDPRMYDPDFKGPVVNRSCTDVVCCMIFIVFIMGYILLGLVAWANGDARRVTYPTDSQGHFCGQKGTPNENKTVLFYFNLLRCASPSVMINLQCPTTQICVSKCPEKFLTYMEMQILYKKDSSYWEYYRQFCKSTAKPAKSLPEVLVDDDCPTAVFPSKPFLQRCFPDFINRNGTLTVGDRVLFEDGSGRMRTALELREAANGINKILDAREIALKVFEDYATTWYWIIVGLTIAMILSWTFLILLRFIAGCLFWFFTLGMLEVVGYGIVYCFQQYTKLQQHPESSLTIYNIGIQNNISMYFQWKQTWFILMIILCVLELTIILLLIFLRKRIHLAIVLLKEGSKAIGYIPSTLVYPVLTFILLSVCFSYWIVTALFLATSGVPVYKVSAPEGQCIHENETCDPRIFNMTDVPKACPGALCNFAFYGGKSLYHQYISTLHLYNLFVFLWLINFVVALGQCTLAGAFASYYWAMKKPDDIPALPLFTAFGQAVRYHTGSLAFGSLILALIQMFKVILEYLDRRLKNAQNNISKFLKCCLGCCFWCLEKMVKFLNKNAYIMIAIYGKNFCRSARDAFNLLMRNILKVAVTDEVTNFVLLLGKILVSGFIGILAFLLFTEKMPVIFGGPISLNYYWVPLLTVIFGSYLVAHGCFSVYATCVETIFLCFLDDLERNEGSAARPFFVSSSLMKILLDKDS